jgi:hypothetical protein
MNTTDLLVALLVAIVLLLLPIGWRLGRIDDRLREKFPTAKEQDYEWSQVDPAGHWHAHSREKHEDDAK